MMAAARSREVRDRLALASRRDIPRELLFFLAADLAPTVRRLIAQNPESPLEADLVLARDREDAVRDGLVAKTVSRIPGNHEPDPEPLNELLVQVLEVLAADPSDAIRLALSDAMADLRHAPRSAIRMLAEDKNPAIASPILRRSPVLQDEDLLDSARLALSDLHVNALAGRPHLPASVADAVAGIGNDASVMTLLMNPTAHIREQTLDRLLDHIPDHPNWFAPMATRANLPKGAAERLAEIIVQSIRDGIKIGEFDRDALARWAGSLAGERIEREAEQSGTTQAGERDHPPNEAVLMALIEQGDAEALAQKLAELSGLSIDAVGEILAAAAPRGIVSLAWAANLSMGFAMTLQSQIARVVPAAMLMPDTDGGYPLSREEMQGQLSFFGATTRPAYPAGIESPRSISRGS